MQPMDWIQFGAALSAVIIALTMRPWRNVGPAGPPWPWLAWWVMMPALWGADRYAAMPMIQPLSGASLLMLMCGWPLAVIAMVPVAVATALLAQLSPAEALDRYVWLGAMPATLAMMLGGAMRRWLPHHLMVYIFARGFFATAIAGTASGAMSALFHAATPGLGAGDVVLGRWLSAWGDAWLAGMIVAIFVAFRPQWLATYADRIYLPVDRK
jgi:uncharacterized membrane protein